MQDLVDSHSTPTNLVDGQNGYPQGRRKEMQKRVFTRWMNVFLQRRDPPLKVCDLFTDIQDGRMLMALLEELSGCKLLYRFRSSSHRIFRLNNISKALAFLDDRHVRLLDIDPSGIADGIPSVVLNLIWNIILHFQVKEATGGLQRRLSSSLSSLSLSTYPSTGDLSPQTADTDSYSCNTLPRKGKKTAREPKYHSKAIKTLLHWVQRCTSKYGVIVDDFGASWRSGLAFLALIKSMNPDLVDLRESLSKEPKENIQQAFMVAHQCLDVPLLLEPEDVMCSKPDEQSIITYVSMFLGRCSVIDEDHMVHCDFPEIPSFGSIEPVGFGGTLADDPEALALLKTFEKSNEQQLWKQWSKAVPCSSNKSDTSFSSNQRVLEPPSPLEAGVANQEIRSWIDKGLDRGHGRRIVHRSLVSQSSEEGIYTLSALDSDEEEAYSYILDLNRDVFQPNNPSKRQVPKVEEETAEEMEEESKHLEGLGMFNGGRYKQREGHLCEDTDFNPESAERAQSVAHRKFDLDKSRNSLREKTNNGAVLDLEPEAETGSRKEPKFRRETNSDASTEEESNEKTESDRKNRDGFDKTQDGGAKGRVFEAVNGKYADEEGAELYEKLGHMTERTAGRDLGRLKKGQDLKEQKEMEEACVEDTETSIQECVKSENYKDKTERKTLTGDAGFKSRNRNITTVNSTGCKAAVKMEEALYLIQSSDFGPVQTEDAKKRKPMIRRHEDLMADDKASPKRSHDDIHEGDNGWTAACRASSQSFRNDKGLSLRSIAASCNIKPLELEILLLLWILLYCYLILPQMYNQPA
ncbi:PREDICTED: uncharacterized protein LOC107097360 [Cyprinodon variegatus]|uniref:Calponin-homology (CH) domain-containing protein n=2 Tax=Cyprinodon variegatus TaxID=28743 RepID=A0A3Q2DLI4_CYPVA|nr:PREDICTED: uncharacterized protein LOC107097360 [Cyprinodon variegatus]